MKESKFSLEKIKNWFIILGIKLANFIKEHKYVSAGIGVLICTCVIVMVAFASDTDPNEGKISVDSLNVSASNESEQTLTGAPSFSTVNYTVDFKLKCLGCGHIVVLERPKALKAITKLEKKAE